jgi:glycosyltransferase involved in cell wall biosynthesis
MPLTITCTRYTEPAWLVQATLESLARQENVEAVVLFLDQQDDPRLRAWCAAHTKANLRFQYVIIPAQGLSVARNRAIELSPHDLILFIDSDAVADPGWARSLAATLERDRVGIAGCRIVPRWHRRPLLIARSRIVLNSYSMFDLGPGEVATSRVVGAGFGIHRGRLGNEARFHEAFGRRPGGLLGGEENELCTRARACGLDVIYNGNAVVEHQVLPERIAYGWVMRRFYYAGFERALTATGLQPSPRGRRFWDYVAYALTLPASLLGYWRGRRFAAAARRADQST